MTEEQAKYELGTEAAGVWHTQAVMHPDPDYPLNYDSDIPLPYVDHLFRLDRCLLHMALLEAIALYLDMDRYEGWLPIIQGPRDVDGAILTRERTYDDGPDHQPKHRLKVRLVVEEVADDGHG